MSSINRISLAPAWILHRYAWRDSSLLLEVFTRDHGRIGLVARGARAARGRWHNQLQILHPLLLSWVMRGELGTLNGAEPVRGSVPASGRQLFSACYLNELLLRLLSRHDPHPGLFDAYERAIALLPGNEEQALRCFEKSLLQELGYGLLLDKEAGSGAPVDAMAIYEYQPERGPVRCAAAGDAGLYLHGSSLLALHHEQPFDRQAGRELKALLRAVLGLYLGARPLRTRTVLRQLAALERAQRERATINAPAPEPLTGES
jgi:DNA repair protein RecO (recombination protein O)